MIDLRDVLYKKIRNSHLLMFDIKLYESWIEGDPRKSYQHLLDVIERQITRIREDKHVAAREKYARDFRWWRKVYYACTAPSTPAPQDANPKAKAKAKLLKEKAAKAKVEAAPVLPSPQPKQHAKGKGKGKKSWKVEERQVQVHETRRRSHAISTLSRSLARKGKIVSTVMTRRRSAASKTGGSGKGGGKTPRSQSPANRTKKIDEPCWHWAKGKVPLW